MTYPETAPLPGGSVVVRSYREADSLVIAVSDDGPGIAAEEMGLLFKPFTATSTRPTGDEKSTGLGLSIARWIAEEHAGTVELVSALGQGTTATVRLPETDA